MLNIRTSQWDKSLYFLFLGLYVILAISAIFAGITSWDEETDYLGIRTQIAHAANLIRGEDPDYKNIHSNLEYYGVIGLLPAWLFWFFQQSLVIGRLSLPKALFYPAADHQLTGFFAGSHLILAIEFVFLSLVVVRIAQILGSRIAWISGCLILFNPSLLGHSFVNPKDIPFALFYTLYTYTLLRRRVSKNSFLYCSSVFFSALLINQKFVALAPVFVSELLFAFNLERERRSIKASLLLPILAILMALAFQPAAWLVNPFQYLSEAFDTFSNHEWGGCMYWSGTCIGVHHPEWSTGLYIAKWLSIKIPVLWFFLIATQFIYCLINPKRLLTFGHSPWLLVYAQCLVIPLMAIIKQSNLYDADRHLLFIYPPLALIATNSLERIIFDIKNNALRVLCLSTTFLFSATLFLDSLSINPYQTAYLNEFARFRHDHTTTSLDYWAVSSKELIRNSQLYGSLPTPPQLKSGIWISPFWIAFRQLAGVTSDDNQYPSPLFQLRDVTSFKSHESRPCQFDSEVKRNILFASPLTMSRLYLCSD